MQAVLEIEKEHWDANPSLKNETQRLVERKAKDIEDAEVTRGIKHDLRAAIGQFLET